MRIYFVENEFFNTYQPGGIRTYIDVLSTQLEKKGIENYMVGTGASNHKSRIPITDSMVSNLNFFLRLFRFARNLPDSADSVYHFHHPYMVIPFAIFHKKSKFVLTVHGRQDISFRNRHNLFITLAYRFLSKSGLKKYHFLVFDNRSDSTYFLDKFKQLQKINSEIISPGIDLSVFKPGNKKSIRIEKELPENGKIIVWAGRFHPDKNLFFLIDVFSRVKEIMPDAFLVLAGDGELKLDIEKYVKDIKLKDVIFTGQKTPGELAQFFAAGDLFMLTSHHEGGPLVVKEALACNLPVISVNVGDISTYLGKFSSCILAERDVQIFASKAIEMLNSDAKTDYSHQINEFSSEVFAEKISGIYRNLFLD